MSERQRTTIELLRHGEPVGGRRYRGQLDDPLSDRGWQQMRAAVGVACPWRTVISSPLSRCAAFAAEVGVRCDLPVRYDPRLQEIGFGQWEGQTPAALTADDPERLLRFWADPQAHRPPGAESLAAFGERVVAAWQGIVAEHAGGQVLVVAHAGVIRRILCHLLEIPDHAMFRLQIASAARVRVVLDSTAAWQLPRIHFLPPTTGEPPR